jgi:hypothetical protein
MILLSGDGDISRCCWSFGSVESFTSLTSPISCGARRVWITDEESAGGRGKPVFGENRKQLIWIGGKGAICSGPVRIFV